MRLSKLAVMAVAGLSMVGCGGSGVRVYRGTTTTTLTAAGQTSTQTDQGSSIIVTNGSDANEFLFMQGTTEYSATLNGTLLSFAPGQTISFANANGTSTTNLSNGQGTLSAEALQLTLGLAVTEAPANAGTTTYTGTMTFSGTRE